jgi:hypothetical protein
MLSAFTGRYRFGLHRRLGSCHLFVLGRLPAIGIEFPRTILKAFARVDGPRVLKAVHQRDVTTQVSQQFFSIDTNHLQIQMSFLSRCLGAHNFTRPYFGKDRLQLRHCESSTAPLNLAVPERTVF